MRRTEAVETEPSRLRRSVLALAVGLVGAGLALVPAPAATAEPGPATPSTSAIATSIPAAGSATSSPATGITFTGVPGDAVGAVTVVGSRSGAHAGSTQELPGGAGLAFTPDVAFTPGEVVSVSSAVRVRGGDGRSFRFTVGTPAKDPGPQLLEDEARSSRTAVPPAGGTRAATPAPKFATRPDLRPPGVTIDVPASGTSPGYLFATPNLNAAAGVDQGVMIYDDAGQPVWFRKVSATTSGNAFVGTFQGKPAIAWYEGNAPYGPGNYRGEWVVVDQSYREVARIRMGNGYQADIHDLHLTDRGTAYQMAYNPLRCTGDAPLVGCKVGATVLESVLQEVDLGTGMILWEWHSLDHVPLSDSYLDITAPSVDYIHTNSLDEDTDGNVLLSARTTSALYKIDRASGELIWTFGGRSTDFPNLVNEPNAITGPDFPHHFRSRGAGSYSYFDNSSRRAGPSRGAVVTLDPGTGTATYTKQLTRNPPVFANTQGSIQGLPSGHELIAWGDQGIVTEYDGAGTSLFDARLTSSGSYRQFRYPWTGTPAEAPVAKASPVTGGTSVAVSWNGDTRTASWRILAGSSPDALAPVTTVARSGFETTTTVGSAPWVAVEALDGSSTVLGRSVAVRGSQWFRELTPPAVGATYTPVVGDFGGSRNDDVLYYRPGAGADFLHVSDGAGGFTSVALTSIGSTYTPLVGDFVGDDRDEVLWWRPGVPTAYLWRFDRAARGAAPLTASASVTVPTTVTKALTLDNRPNHGGGADELLWYAAGSAPDRIDRFTWPVGGAATATSRAVGISGNYTPVSGDFDGNGLADVLFYGAGSQVESIWFLQGGPAGSTGQRSVAYDVAPGYAVHAGNFTGTDARDELLFAASGAAADRLWTFDASGTRTSTVADTDATGTGYVLSGAIDTLMSWSAGTSPSIWQLTTRPPANRPSGNTAVPAGYQPLVGDFVGAGGTSSVLWYAPGSSPERLYAGS